MRSRWDPVDWVLVLLVRVECLIFRHVRVTRFAGKDLPSPRCLCCGKRMR